MTAAVAEDYKNFKFFDQDGANKRGIPEAIFIDNVEKLCQVKEPNYVLDQLQELYSRYQYMQSSLVSQRSSLKAKLPDIVSALDCVNHLVERRDNAEGEEAEYTYQLSENVWSRAKVVPTSNVCLWLGANVMLEYTLDEAHELLQKNEANAKTTISALDEDMAFLRDQLTTTEVNVARAHNHNVKQRQQQKEVEGAENSGQAYPSKASAPAAVASAPSGGGSPNDLYTWKQDSDEMEVSVKVPAGAQKGDIKVTILAESICIEHLGKVILKGELAGRCSPNGCTWTMNNGRVEITLEKGDSTPWPSLFVTEN